MNDVATLERPVNQLAERTVGIGHNQPPLHEQLVEELAADKARTDELIGSATEARIENDDDAAKVTALVSLIRSHEKALDAKRNERKRPFLEAGRQVDAAFGALQQPLSVARGSLSDLLTAHQRQRDEAARKERERLAAEQRKREAEAERARQEADAAAAQGKSTLAAELAAIRAEEGATRAARQAQTLRPEPIRSSIGSLSMRREIAFEINDLRKLLGWMLKQPVKNQVEQAARTIMGSYLKSLGVDAIERGVEVPGLTARVESRAQVR